jgi:serine/threonine-protein kinase
MERFLKSRYKIGEKISENPFSVTYKGCFLGTDKPVVIKIYKRGTLNSALINRMKQKVRDLSLINHHGIAKLIDGDYGWQGFYYVRDYVEGTSLQQILESNPGIGAEKALTIAEEVSRALEAAHSKGIVHGGVKPSNIIIDPQGVVKLVDFVIEGEIKGAMPQKILSLIDNGNYVSPEELVGYPATTSSDIYSLGTVLYEMLIARTPAFEKGLAGGLKKMKSSPAVNLEALVAFPRYLQDILGRVLQADPLLRFSSISQFRESLENKRLIENPSPGDEYLTIFENTVTQYGGEEVNKESESIQDLGRVRIKWGKEKHRNWVLALILGVAILSGIIYAFMFGR